MKIERIPRVFYQDADGKHPLRYIQVYGTKYEFMYDESGDIVLKLV